MSEETKSAEPLDPWNRCPTCSELVDVDDCVDGSEVRCLACNARLVLAEYVDETCGLVLADEGDGEEPENEPDWTPEARERARVAVDVATGKTQAVVCGDVTITAPLGMALGEVWNAIKARPEMRVCLDAELRAARESARGTTPAELEMTRRDIRAAVLEDAFRAGVESANANREEAIESAHAGGIVEGLRRASSIVGRSIARDVMQQRIRDAIDEASANVAPADRPLDRAALLELATGWEREAGRLGYHGTPLAVAAQNLRRLLDAPRDGDRVEAASESDSASRIPSLDQLDALLTKYRAQSHGEPIDLLGAIDTAEMRAEAAHVTADPSVRRHLLLDCAAWALAAVCEIDGTQTSTPVDVTRDANDAGGGP